MGCPLLILCVPARLLHRLLLGSIFFSTHFHKKHTNSVYVFLYGTSRLSLKDLESDIQVLQYAQNNVLFLSGLCLKRPKPRALMKNLQTKWFDRAPWLTSYPSKPHNYKRGKSPMISIDNIHQGYIFRVCSVVLLTVQRYGLCWCWFFPLLYFIYIYTFLRARGQEGVHACCALLMQLPSVCV